MTQDCIEFDGPLNDCGYGLIGGWLAHRLAWFRKHGPIPDGMLVCHTCDNPACWNIEHLFLGTPADNVADRHAKGRDAKQKGSQNGRAVLNEIKVKIIKFLLRQGKLSLNDLAREFGVCKSTIVHIKMGRIWRHIG